VGQEVDIYIDKKISNVTEDRVEDWQRNVSTTKAEEGLTVMPFVQRGHSSHTFHDHKT